MNKYIKKMNKSKLKEGLENEENLLNIMFKYERRKSMGILNSLLYAILMFSALILVVLLSIFLYISYMSSFSYVVDYEPKLIKDLITSGVVLTVTSIAIKYLRSKSYNKFSNEVSRDEIEAVKDTIENHINSKHK